MDNDYREVLTSEEFKTLMEQILKKSSDIETNHRSMDSLMCEVLDSLGYSEGVEIFRRAHKWYS